MSATVYSGPYAAQVHGFVDGLDNEAPYGYGGNIELEKRAQSIFYGVARIIRRLYADEYEVARQLLRDGDVWSIVAERAVAAIMVQEYLDEHQRDLLIVRPFRGEQAEKAAA